MQEDEPKSQTSQRGWFSSIAKIVTGTVVTSVTGLAGWGILAAKKNADAAKVLLNASDTGTLETKALQIAGLEQRPACGDVEMYGKYQTAISKAASNIKKSVKIHAIDKVELGVIAVGAGLGAAWLIGKLTARSSETLPRSQLTQEQRLNLREVSRGLDHRSHGPGI